MPEELHCDNCGQPVNPAEVKDDHCPHCGKTIVASQPTRGLRRFRMVFAVAITFAVVALAASILRWHTVQYCDDPTGVTKTLSDCRNISTAILLFNNDTDLWPIRTSADHSPESRLDFLFGNMGDMPDFSDEARESWGTRSEDMYFTLVTNGRTSPWYRYGHKVEGDFDIYSSSRPSTGGWAGPYLPYVTNDPWGYAYLISVSGFEGGTKPDNHVWCLSAGFNHIVETPAWATQTRGDDIGYRTK